MAAKSAPEKLAKGGIDDWEARPDFAELGVAAEV
jgi:hypothetical protein